VVGNPKPRSRTQHIAELVANRIASAFGARHELTVDLSEYAEDLFRWPDERLAGVSSAVASADVLVVASPTYKGAYTGLLKSFLDRYPNGGLSGVIAIPVMTGGEPGHALAPAHSLSPVLLELGASVPAKGLFFLMSQMDCADAVVDRWAEENLTKVFWRGRPSAPD